MPEIRTIDVREIIPRERHPLVFNTFAGLNSGESFVLIADHDPRPLHRHFETKHDGQFSWNYLEQGPAVWRVRIGRSA